MEDVEGKLCQTCTATFHGETFIYNHGEWHRANDQNYFNRTHHKKYCEFVASKNGGCFICCWLWAKHVPPPPLGEKEGECSTLDGFQSFCRVGDHEDMGAYNVYFHVIYPWAAAFELHVSMAQDIIPDRYGDTALSLSRSDLNLKERPWHTLDPNLGSNQDLKTIGGWISSCEKEHVYCNMTRSAGGTFLPSRIIDVKDAGLGVVRLRNRDDVEVQQNTYPAYWTLSHRWGDPNKILQLRKATEHRFRDGICLEELSPTFRDAVLLVHRLRYQYIWIDSLCVLQDSLADWQKEANAMVDVYRHSFCNISAVGASYDPSNCGLFCTRRLYPFTTNASIVKVVTRDQRETIAGPWTVCNESAWADDIESAPLSSRGWVVQERFLPARVVHFTQNQIYWECLEGNHSTDPTGNPFHRRRRRFGANTGYKTSRLELARTQATLTTAERPYSDPNENRSSAHSYHSYWGSIVGIYVGCKLTKESDRFLAMSGIAKAFREVNGDVYLAGLWRRMLYTDLLWHSRANTGVQARRCSIEELYAPSWSWASVVGGDVQLGVPQNKFGSLPTPLIRLVEARIVPEPPDGDPMGLLRSAELDIECMRYYYRWLGREEKKLRVFTDEARTHCYFEKQDSPGPGSQLEDLRLDTSELVERFAAADEIEGVCVPIHGTYQGYGGGTNEYIMLEHDSGDRFRRIGLLSAGAIGKWISEWSDEKRSRITLI